MLTEPNNPAFAFVYSVNTNLQLILRHLCLLILSNSTQSVVAFSHLTLEQTDQWFNKIFIISERQLVSQRSSKNNKLIKKKKSYNLALNHQEANCSKNKQKVFILMFDGFSCREGLSAGLVGFDFKVPIFIPASHSAMNHYSAFWRSLTEKASGTFLRATPGLGCGSRSCSWKSKTRLETKGSLGPASTQKVLHLMLRMQT